MTETDVCNLAAIKVGGFGDAETGMGTISDIDNPDKNSSNCKLLLPVCRRRVITELAQNDCPFRETIKYAGLGASLAVGSLPEIGNWQYAFNLPGDCLIVSQQFHREDIYIHRNKRRKYNYETITGKDGIGLILLTNHLTNTARTSAYIEYIIDQTNVNSFSIVLIECIATLLASELCPIIGKDIKTRQNLLAEYQTVAVKNAKVFNQSQYNREEKRVGNYFGGRGEHQGWIGEYENVFFE